MDDAQFSRAFWSIVLEFTSFLVTLFLINTYRKRASTRTSFFAECRPWGKSQTKPLKFLLFYTMDHQSTRNCQLQMLLQLLQELTLPLSIALHWTRSRNKKELFCGVWMEPGAGTKLLFRKSSGTRSAFGSGFQKNFLTHIKIGVQVREKDGKEWKIINAGK